MFKGKLRAGLLSALVFLLSVGLFAVGANERNLAGKFDNVDDVVSYKSFEKYDQAPELAKLVQEGKLPPVEDRLPKQPLFWRKETMVDGPGVYGGVWRDTFAADIEGWNWAGGQTQGWFGINQMIQETLLTTGPMWVLKKAEPMPHLAKSWEWSEDGKTLTMYLMEGVKWSDGVEFTAEDVLFTYRDNILDDAVTSWQSAGAWTFGDKVTELEKVDDYTIKWHFGKAFPIRAFYLMDYLDLSVSPAHIYKHYHPKYNSEMTYSNYQNATPPEDLPPVVLGPWVPVKYEPDQILVMERNPYYWQVDEEGNQLPYFDEVWFSEEESGKTRTLNLIGGSGDRTVLENPQMYSMALKEAQKPDAHFKVQWEDFYIEYRLLLNQSLYAGVESDRDEALRELFRKEKFRQAVSHAINRKGIANAAFPGPFTKPYYGGYPSGSPYYEESEVVKYPYDQEKAGKLLSELGFEDTNGNGIRNWPENSPLGGKELVIEVMVSEGQSASVSAVETMIPLFREVGIRLRLKVQKSPTVNSRTNSGKWEMFLTRADSTITPFMYPEEIGPISQTTPVWHIAAPGGKRDLRPFEKKIEEMLKSTATMESAEERLEAFREILHIFTKNVYAVGVYQARRGLGIAKRFKNLPADMPVRLYQWTTTSTPVQIFWTSKDEQIKSQYEDLIPTPESYRAKDWYPVE